MKSVLVSLLLLMPNLSFAQSIGAERLQGLSDEKIEIGKEFLAACTADIKTFCKTVKPGHGRLMKCVRDLPTEKRTQPCEAFVAQCKK